MESFLLWLEFEAHEGGYPGPNDDPECDFCNVQIQVGSVLYAANVWTFGDIDRARMESGTGQRLSNQATWLVAPDLLVSRLDRATIATAVSELIQSVGLPRSWLVAGRE